MVALLAPACGASSGGGGNYVVSCGGLLRGCADLLNFSPGPANMMISGDSPASANLVPTGNPGRGGVMVDPTIGAMTSFTVMRSGAMLGTLGCKVGPDTWASVNPSLVLQQTGQLSCVDWTY